MGCSLPSLLFPTYQLHLSTLEDLGLSSGVTFQIHSPIVYCAVLVPFLGPFRQSGRLSSVPVYPPYDKHGC